MLQDSLTACGLSFSRAGLSPAGRLTEFQEVAPPPFQRTNIDWTLRRVAPADFSTGALTSSVRGRFDHTALPLIRLMKFPRCFHTPLAWETLTITLKSTGDMFSEVIAPVMFPF